jgi:hypothetical protein
LIRKWRAFVITPLTLAGALLAPSASLRQGPPGTNLKVDVRVPSVTMRGDTVTVEHVLHNRRSSLEQLSIFTVDAPAEPISITLPQPSEAWDNGTTYRDLSVATWAALGGIAQGTSSPRLSFRALGLPGIVRAWYQGNALPTLGEDESEHPRQRIRIRWRCWNGHAGIGLQRLLAAQGERGIHRQAVGSQRGHT